LEALLFFLWSALEDTPKSFQDRIGLQKLLQEMFEQGKQKYSTNANFNFIAGYTVSIFPYEFGDYEKLEKEGHQMLLKATKLDPDNLIYKMVYLGSGSNYNPSLYLQTTIQAAPKVMETFIGQGLLNKYFRQVLLRADKKANR
jgi:hypothetical protein